MATKDIVDLVYMKEMIGHTLCSSIEELEDEVLVLVDEELGRDELCEGATVTKGVDGDLEAAEEGAKLEVLRLVLTDEVVRGDELPEVPRAEPGGMAK
jgi:hypothetical protein